MLGEISTIKNYQVEFKQNFFKTNDDDHDGNKGQWDNNDDNNYMPKTTTKRTTPNVGNNGDNANDYEQ